MIPGIFKEKLLSIISTNPSFSTLKSSSKIFKGEVVPEFNLAPDIISCYMNAQVISGEVERFFFTHKYTLAPQRQSFSLENLKCHMFLLWNGELLK